MAATQVRRPVFDGLIRLSAFDGKETGFERQDRDLREWATREDVVLENVYVEEESGFDVRSKRHGLGRIEERLVRGEIDGAVFWKGDRLGRRGMTQVGRLIDTGKRIVFLMDHLDSSVDGHRLPMAMVAEMARRESENIAFRVGNAKAYLRPKGKWLGGPIPHFHHNDDGFLRLRRDLVVRGDGQLVLRRLVDDALAGATVNQLARWLTDQGVPSPREGRWDARRVRMAMKNPDPAVWDPRALAEVARVDNVVVIPRQVARALNEAGIPAPSNGWQANTVSQLLQNPLLVGWAPLGKPSANGRSRWGKRGDYVRDPQTLEPVVVAEPVMTPAERNRVIELIRSRKLLDSKGVTRGRRSSPESPARHLTGLVFCQCGLRLAHSGGSWRCVAAARGAPGPYVTIWAVSLERLVKEKVFGALTTLPTDHPLIKRAGQLWTEQADPDLAAERKLRREALAEAEADLGDIEDARYLRKEFTTGEQIVRWERLRHQKEELVTAARRALDAVPDPEPDPRVFGDREELEEAWNDADAMRKAALMGLVVARIVVRKGNGRGRPFDPGRVQVFGHDGSLL